MAATKRSTKTSVKPQERSPQLSREMALFWLGDLEEQFNDIASVAISGLAYQETRIEEYKDPIVRSLLRTIQQQADDSTQISSELRTLLEKLPEYLANRERRKSAMAKTKRVRKPAAAQPTITPLDKHDPRVRAAAAELIAEIIEKQKAERAAQVEKGTKDRAALEQAEKTKAKKRAPVKDILMRLHKITDPLRALHDTAEQAFNSSDHETALIVTSNLAMVCLKRLEDCLVDLGDTWAGGSTDEWLAGTEP
jgi:uncharacterized membrane-anchored protein YjiN (DUF445 family)